MKLGLKLNPSSRREVCGNCILHSPPTPILRGLLQLENVTYGIEPLESSTTLEHILYEIQNHKIDYFPLKENYTNSQDESGSYRILVKPLVSLTSSCTTYIQILRFGYTGEAVLNCLDRDYFLRCHYFPQIVFRK